MKRTTKYNFRDNLRNSIREAGTWFQENADQLIPDVELLKDMNIWIRFDSADGVPEINVEHTWYSNEMVKAMFREKKDDGSESDMEKKDPGSL